MVYGSVYGSIHENALSNVESFEFDESMSFMEMGAQTVEESTEDWNNMMKAIALTELSYVAETGQELIYEAVDFVAIKDKVVGWLKKLWAKIKGIANAAMAKFKSFGKDDEGFISKYNQYFSEGYKKIPDGFSYKGYKFDDEVIKGAVSIIQRESGEKKRTAISTSKATDNFKDEFFKGMVDDYRGKLVGENRKVSSSEFTKVLNKYLRGSESKVYLNKSNIDVNKLVSHVSGCKTAIDDAKEAESTLKDDIDTAIDTVEEVASRFSDEATKDGISPDEAGKNRTASSFFTKYSDYLKQIEQVNASWFSTYISVLKDRNRQSKALLVKLVSYANGVGGKKSTNEAASILEDRFAAIFD